LYWIAIPITLLAFGFYGLKESPRYLYERNKLKAIENLNEIA